MKIITEPRVVMVGRSVFMGHPTYKIPADGDDAIRLGAFTAKGCYDSYGEDGRSNTENQRQVISQLHGSVLEHISFSFFIEGITRGCSLELNRHRHFAISQRSTRYTKEEDAAIVLEPYYADLYRRYQQGETGREAQFVVDHIDAARSAIGRYDLEVKLLMDLNPLGLAGFELRKWARGKARNILPHSLETRGTWTANLRAWRWFIEQRSSRYAEPEIRRLAHYVHRELSVRAPLYLVDYTAEMVDGWPEYTTPHRKV
jgi:thymidylate synthase (FAD)